MSNPSRRAFVMSVVAGSTALAASRVAAQAAAVKLEENDPQAVALGYKMDTTKVDQSKYPNHTPDQMCHACNFYQGKAADAAAPCQLFAGKQVQAKGWCSGFAKKAA